MARNSIPLFPVNAEGMASLQCPACGKSGKLNVSQLRGGDKPVTIKCPCGNQYSARFDFSAAQTEAMAAGPNPGLATPNPGRTASSQALAKPAAVPGAASSPPNETEDELPEIEAEPITNVPPTASTSSDSPSPISESPTSAKPCERVFQVDNSGKAKIICPSCGFARSMQVPLALSPRQVVQIECRCKTCFLCRFEFPAVLDPNRRKPGEYFPLKPGELADRELLLFNATDAGKATILCPNCGHSRQIDTKAENLPARPMGFLCHCGNTFRFRVQYRQTYRKPVNLAGEYTNLRLGGKKGVMYVKDISLGGVGFMAQIDPEERESHGIRPKDLLEISFRLDDRLGTKIVRQVVVRSVRGYYIGTQFNEKRAHDKELGFYLMA